MAHTVAKNHCLNGVAIKKTNTPDADAGFMQLAEILIWRM